MSRYKIRLITKRSGINPLALALLMAVTLNVVPTRGDSFLAVGASADSKELVVARYSRSADGFDSSIVQRIPIGIEAAPVVYHAKKKLIYVASLRPVEKAANYLLTFRLGDGGKITSASKLELKHGCAYLSLDRSGSYLLSASYFDGYVHVIQLDRNGIPKSTIETVFEGKDKAHSIKTSRDNRFAYVPYVKDNNGLYQYAFAEGKLKAVGKKVAEVPGGAGPRHVAYHPTKPLVYFSNEQQLGITAYRIGDAGQLELLQMTEPDSPKAGNGIAASDIAITRSGQFVFTGIRDFADGKVDCIHRYRTDEAGKLTFQGKTKSDKIPWGLRVTPDDRHLFVTAAHGETLTAFRITNNGDLKKVNSLKWGRMIRAIAIVPID